MEFKSVYKGFLDPKKELIVHHLHPHADYTSVNNLLE